MTMLTAIFSFALLLQDDDRVRDFSRQLDSSLDSFAETLRTPSGQIVMKDRVAKTLQELRRQAEREAFPEYLRTNFVEENGSYRLKNDELRKRLDQGYADYLRDVDEVRAAMKEVADKLVATPEINAKLREFLTQDGMAEIVYVTAVRPIVRPDLRVLERELGQLFARGSDGLFGVPEIRVDAARGQLQASERKYAAARKMQARLKEFLATVEASEKLRAAADDLLFPIIYARDAFNNGDPRAAEKVADEFKPDLAKLEPKLDAYAKARRLLDGMHDAVHEFVALMRTGDELHDGWRKLLELEIPVLPVAERISGGSAFPADVLKIQLQRGLRKNDDGSLQVRPEAEGQVKNNLAQTQRQIQGQQQRGKRVDDFAKKLADPELQKIYLSFYGKIAVEQATREIVASKKFDAFGAWTQKHFERNGDVWTLRKGSEKEIPAFLAEVERLKKESEKDDFPKR